MFTTHRQETRGFRSSRKLRGRVWLCTGGLRETEKVRNLKGLSGLLPTGVGVKSPGSVRVCRALGTVDCLPARVYSADGPEDDGGVIGSRVYLPVPPCVSVPQRARTVCHTGVPFLGRGCLDRRCGVDVDRGEPWKFREGCRESTGRGSREAEGGVVGDRGRFSRGPLLRRWTSVPPRGWSWSEGGRSRG